MTFESIGLSTVEMLKIDMTSAVCMKVDFICFDSRTFPFGATADPSLPDTENLKENTIQALLLGDQQCEIKDID